MNRQRKEWIEYHIGSLREQHKKWLEELTSEEYEKDGEEEFSEWLETMLRVFPEKVKS